MKPRQKSPHTPLRDLDLLLGDSAAGIQISGDSGTGKSKLMELMIQTLAAKGKGLLLIDPHGDLAAAVETNCASLPDRIRRKVVVLHPAATDKPQGAINPLAVPAGIDDPVQRRALLVGKTGQCAKIVLSTFGQDSFNFMPTLFKLSHLFLMTLGISRLTIPDVRLFFDTHDPIYEALSQLAPDFIGQLELEHLAELKPAEREEAMASTKNRFLALLLNPIIELLLGKVGSTLDARQLIQEAAIVIINLEKRGVLRDEDVEIIANLVLTEFLFAIFNTPEAERVPFTLFLDELPVFASCFTLLTKTFLPQTRKFLARGVFAHQGVNFFPDRTEDRLLNALVGQCRTHIYFRHANPIDARYFAEIIKLSSLDPYQVKHVLKTPQQYQDGREIVTLTDEGENWGTADQTGSSTATADSSTQSHSETSSRSNSNSTSTSTRTEDLLEQAVTNARGETTGSSSTVTDASGTTNTQTNSASTTRSRGGNRTRKQTLVPRLKTRDIVSSVQFLSTDEQLVEAAGRISEYPIGSAAMHVAGQGTSVVSFPLPKNPFPGTPKFAVKKLQQLRQMIAVRPEYDTFAAIAAQREMFRQSLARHLHALCAQRRQQPLLIDPQQSSGLIVRPQTAYVPPDCPHEF